MRPRQQISLIALGLLILAVFSAAEAEEATEELEQPARGVGDRARQGYEHLKRRRTFDIDGVPYGATGLPIVFLTPASGLHYGGWMELANYGREPYAYRANVQWYLTTKGKRNHYMRLEFPTAFGYPLNTRVLTRDVKNTGANYYGIGNETRISDEEVDGEPDYYSYLLEQQQSAFDLEYATLEPLVLFCGIRFNRSVPSRIDEEKADAYYVFNLPDDEVLGRGGGWANFLLWGLIYDTRDDQEMPTAGMLSEASLQKGGAALGADYGYRRLTLIHTQYSSVRWAMDTRPYVLVTRVVLENIHGDAPFYELTEVGGSIRGIEVGGRSFMRGYRSRRFADRQKMLFSGELRRTIRNVRWRGHYYQALGMLYIDAGRVAPRFWDVLNPTGLHLSAGIGSRITWNSQLSVRIDLAVSPEGPSVLLSFGNLF